jgi:hypothetical protein
VYNLEYKSSTQKPSSVVIDRKRMFLFRPKTNIREENAAEYSAQENKRSTKKEKIKKTCFSGAAVVCFRSCKLARFIRSTETYSLKHIDK